MKKIPLFTLLITLNISLFSQNLGFSPRNILGELSGFNFFTGKDAELFETYPKTLGSGVIDLSGQHTLINLWLLRPENRNIGLATTIAFKVSKYMSSFTRLLMTTCLLFRFQK